MTGASPGEMSIESLAEAVDKAAAAVADLDDGPREAAGELRAAIEAVHKAGLVTIVRRLQDDDRGKDLLYELVDDPLIRMLFSLHGIIRTGTPTGVGAAGEHTGREMSGDACGCGHSCGEPRQAGPALIPLSAIGLRPGELVATRGISVKSVTFVNAAARTGGEPLRTASSAGWRPRTWLGAPAPGGLALPAAQPTAAWLYAPRGVHLGAYQGHEVLVVADTGNHRVLIWHEVPSQDEQPCDVVLGQPDAHHEGPAAGTGDTRAGLNLPTGVLVHDGKLVVADAWHHRVLIYDELPESPGAVPDLVLGQPDLDSVAPNAGGPREVQEVLPPGGPREVRGGVPLGGNCAPGTMYWPFGIAVVGGRFYVADTGNRRVLCWTGGLPTSADAPPDVILGQPDGFSREENRGGEPGPDSFRWPHGVTGIGDGLYVADAGNHRVLGWGLHPDRDLPAHLVLGQPDFASASELPYGPQGAGALRFPYAAVADGTTLAVADTANNRILLWDSAAVASATAARGALPAGACRPEGGQGPDATAVLGQPGFGPNGENRWSGVTRDSLCWPYGLSLSGDRLAVADSGNNRVVIWERG